MIFQPIMPIWIIILMGVGLVALCGWRIMSERKSRKRRWIRRLVACVLMVLIGLRPMLPFGSGAMISTDLNVIFVVDATGSMVAEDYNGRNERLNGVRTDIKTLAAGLTGAKFSVVVLDNSPYVAMPFTNDINALFVAADAITPIYTMYSTGSNITAPLETARDLATGVLKRHPDRKVVLYYFGDGEQTSQYELKLPADLNEMLVGGAVFGYGTAEGGKMRDTSQTYNMWGAEFDEERWASIMYLKDYSGGYGDPRYGKEKLSKIDEDNLKKIADGLGLEYYHRSEPSSVEKIVGQIKQDIDKSAARNISSYTDIYWIFALAMTVLLIWEMHTLLKHAGVVVRRQDA